ncbi:ricin-type beta-trefoil lectin domain protein [Streptomyces sp. NPDC051320]|uniref:ricin-type beta-trefoil lectin domain protein n=1 Tax=Streptomyces sp. NPDC051320 TaxID=3154644 RepID=UPI003424B37D
MRSPHHATARGAVFTLFRLLAVFALAVGTLTTFGSGQAHASTNQYRGVNWADPRDNFVNGVLYPSGLSSSDTHASAATVADRVVGQMYSITGANTVRMPINEPTVSSYWPTYTGAIDKALSKGKVILAYWAYANGKPADTAGFNRMWDTVVAKYGSNPNAYFEVINEPYAYGTSALDDLYNDWLSRYPKVPRGRVILDGAGYAQNVAAVGGDSRLNNTLLAVHDYSFFASYEDETSWANHLAGYIGAYAGRTIATEWGGPMSPGSKNGVQYNTIDYSIPSGSFFADYIRGVSSELHNLGMGSVYWPGLRDGDWYSLTTRSGSGAGIKLSLVNTSGLTRLRYAWGIGNGGGTYVRITNAATGLYIDGAGRTANGSNADLWGNSGSRYEEQWTIENDGNFVRIRNRATGLYLDGQGRTSNGAAVGQYDGTGSTNQQWSVLTDANNVRIKNRATGLYIDGMGRTGVGSDLGQYSDSNSSNQQWRITAVG